VVFVLLELGQLCLYDVLTCYSQDSYVCMMFVPVTARVVVSMVFLPVTARVDMSVWYSTRGMGM
jgi:FtsH-binding integral membrane protein